MPTSSRPLIGLDVGGTKVAAGIVRLTKTSAMVENNVKEFTRKKNDVELIRQIVDIVRNLSENKKPKKVGIAIAAQIQTDGRIVNAPNLPKSLCGKNILKRLEQQLRCPVAMDNDVNTFTLAEAHYGIAKKYTHVFGITLGTGVGGGLVIRKKLYTGAHGIAGEIGHIVISDASHNMPKGFVDTPEALASGTAIEQIYFNKTKDRRTALEIEQLEQQGNKVARATYMIMENALARTLNVALTLLDPDVIVIGGSLARAKAHIRSAIEISRQTVLVPQHKRTPILFSRLGSRANIIGAVLV